MNGKIMGEVLNVNGASVFLYTLSLVGTTTHDTITIECPFVPQTLFGYQTPNERIFGNHTGETYLGRGGAYSLLRDVVWDNNLITGKVQNAENQEKAYLVIFG